MAMRHMSVGSTLGFKGKNGYGHEKHCQNLDLFLLAEHLLKMYGILLDTYNVRKYRSLFYGKSHNPIHGKRTVHSNAMLRSFSTL